LLGENRSHSVVCDGKELYLNLAVISPLYKANYLKLKKLDNFFSFTIPYTIPDMYTLLSIQEYNTNNSASGGANTGSVIGDLIGAILISGVSEADSKSVLSKLTKSGLVQHKFRYCIINMDNGDIVF
jgi:hypothetical protein